MILSQIARDIARHFRDVIRSQFGLKVGETFFRLPIGIPVHIDEPWMREAIIRLLPESEGVFLDIGVNLGQTLMSFRSADNIRRYVGFEPNPHCVAAVDRIVTLNEIPSITLIPLACTDSFGVSQLYHYEDSKFDSSASMITNFRPDRRPLRESIIAKGAALECLEAVSVDRIGIVKIDVEGFEADVLEAIEPALHRDRPLILIEVLPIRNDPQRMVAGQRIRTVLDRLGYVSRRVGKTKDGRFDGFSEIAEPGSQTEVVQSDYLLACKSSGLVN